MYLAFFLNFMVVRNDLNVLDKSPLVVELLFVVVNEFKFRVNYV
jgi:hypothetical protein